MKGIVHLEFYELLTECENCFRDTSGMLLKYVEHMKCCIYYTKLQDGAFITKSCKMLQKFLKLQNDVTITLSRNTLDV